MSFETFERTIPVRPGWKREYYDGMARVRPSWAQVAFELSLVPRPAPGVPGLRPLGPSRCQDCRIARRAARGDSSGAYSSASHGAQSYRSESYGSGGYRRQEREMFSATCSDCGNQARVPFQPRGDKPVYCSDCFSKQRSGGGGGGYSRSYR